MTSATCLVVQHLEPEGPYAIATALQEAGAAVRVCRVYVGDQVPENLNGIDGLVVMGGPMSATSDEGFASRRAEVALLARAIKEHVPVLGVCLGAQLLAEAAGGVVHSGDRGSEIGWAPISFSTEAREEALFAGMPSEINVLHWHSDTFELPEGAIRLASSERYVNQAFRVGERAWGLQFHMEVDLEAVNCFVAAFGSDAKAAGADPEKITRQAVPAIEALSPWREIVLSRFATAVCS